MSSSKYRQILKFFLVSIPVILVILFISLPFFIGSMVDSHYVKQEISQFVLKTTGVKISQEKIYLHFFPRPYLKIDGIKTVLKLYDTAHQNKKKYIKPGLENKAFHIDKKNNDNNINLIINNALFYPDLKTLIHARGKNISGTLIIKKIKVNDLTKTGIPIAENIKSVSIDYLKTIFTYNTKGHLTASITGKNPELILNDKKIAAISGKKFTADIEATKTDIKIALKKFTLDYPAMDLSINFLNDKKQKKTSLKFSGNKINIDETKKVSLALTKGNEISNEIFKIIQSGRADDLIVSFSGHNLKTLFKEKNMLIKGKLKNGKIRIPETDIVTTETKGNALVKDGILYTDVQQGKIEHSYFKQAKLKVNLTGHNHQFKGTFPIDADLNELSDILKKLLPGSLLEHELSLCHKIQGRANGVLFLSKTENTKPLFISVQAKDIKLETEYEHLPEKISIKGGSFTYKDRSLISVDRLNGRIGESQFSDLNASIELSNENSMEIKSGKAVIKANEIFPWLISFKKIKTMVFPLKSVSGTITLDSIKLKGPLLHPDKWQYDIDGKFINAALGTKSSKNGITALSLKFNISNQMKLFSDIKANIYKTKLLESLIKSEFIRDIALPLSVSKTELYFKNKDMTFKGNILFQTGPEFSINIHKTDPDSGQEPLRKSKILTMHEKPAPICKISHINLNNQTENQAAAKQTLKNLLKFSIKFAIKDKDISNAVISYTGGSKNITDSSHNRINIKGRLDTRTIKKILKPKSKTAKTFLTITDNKDFIIISHKSSGLIVLTDTLDFNALKKISLQPQINSDTKNLYSSIIFPLNFKLKAGRLLYKTMVLAPFDADIDMDQNTFTVFIEDTKLCNINITGIIDKNNKFGLSMKLYTKKGDIKELMSCMFGKKRLIKGMYSLNVDLNSMGEIYQLTDNLHGTINFTSSKGRIYKLTLLSRILSVINISKFIRGKIPDIAQHGFAYNSMIVKAHVAKNRIILDSAAIKGIDMTFVFTGWIDMIKKTTELKCLVSPFKTADMIIKHIPLLGHIMNNNLISIPVKITGNIDDPDVILLPPSEVGKELINIMQRIITTPFRIIKSLPQ